MFLLHYYQYSNKSEGPYLLMIASFFEYSVIYGKKNMVRYFKTERKLIKKCVIASLWNFAVCSGLVNVNTSFLMSLLARV